MSNKIPLSSLGYTLTLEIQDTERNRDFWLAQPQFNQELREGLRAADILIVPEGDDYEGRGAYFPEGTTEFYHFLQTQTVGVEIAATDEEFQELIRRNELYIIGEFVLSKLVVPIFVALLVDYLKKRVRNPEKDTMKIGLTHQSADGSAKRLEYEGPVSTFEAQIQPLLAELVEPSDSQIPILPTAPDSGEEPQG